MIRNDTLPVYCYHCGNILDLDKKEITQKMQGNIHKDCLKQRRRMVFHLRSKRLKRMLEDPKICKEIDRIDREILRELGYSKIGGTYRKRRGRPKLK